ncbi:MAG: hypothetical protein R3E66_15055 [bacterium]
MDDTLDTRWTKPLAWIALAAAAVPHIFFASPLQLHLEGNMKGWLGLAVWEPAILAGVAFFVGVEFSGRVTPVKNPMHKNAALVIAPLLWILFLALRFEPWWTNMGTMRPTAELQKVLPLHAALGAMQVLFWQGVMQGGLLVNKGVVGRVGGVVTLSTAVSLPYVLHGSSLIEPWTMVILPLALWQLLIALVAETGASYRVMMVVGALFGAAWVWFQQSLLI